MHTYIWFTRCFFRKSFAPLWTYALGTGNARKTVLIYIFYILHWFSPLRAYKSSFLDLEIGSYCFETNESVLNSKQLVDLLCKTIWNLNGKKIQRRYSMANAINSFHGVWSAAVTWIIGTRGSIVLGGYHHQQTIRHRFFCMTSLLAKAVNGKSFF